MDTKLKRFNISALKKAVALILCLVCVAGCAYQALTSLYAYSEVSLYDHTFGDALLYNGKNLNKMSITETNTFKNHMVNYASNLSYMIGQFGDGSEESYNLWKKSVEEGNAIALKNAKNNLINHVVQDSFMTYLALVSEGIVKPLGFIQSAEYSGASYDYEKDYIGTGEISYWELCFQQAKVYIKEELPEAVQKKAEELGADGVFEINNYYKITDYDYENDYEEVVETFQPGYYAFKIDEARLEDQLVKEDYLQKDWYGSASEFKKSYNIYSQENVEKYASGRYFVKDSSGTVYTNIDGLGEKSTKEEIEKVFSELGFYCTGNGYGNLRLPDGDHYCYGGFDADNNNYYEVFYDYEEYSAVHTTTLPVTVYESTTHPSEAVTTVVEVTDRYGEAQVTSVAVTLPQEATTSHYSVDDRTPFVEEESEEFLCFIGVDMFDSYAETDLFRTTADQIETAKGMLLDFALTCGILGTLFLVCFIYLIVKSGRRKGDDEIHLFAADRMFTDWRIVINCLLGWGLFILFVLATDNIDGEQSKMWFTPIVTAIATAFAAVVIDLVLFVTRHIKNRSLLKQLFPVWLFVNARKLYKGKIKPVADEKLLYTKSFSKGTVIRILAVIAVNLVIGFLGAVEAVNYETLFFFSFLAIFDIVVLVWIIRLIGGIRKIFSALEEIRGGNYNVQISVYSLPATLRETAGKVMSLRDGLKTAVEEAVKQEQTKTELITNVSHDLKTPLTSIINYVELLKKCEINDEDAKEYLGVLGEKSDRLKKLIEDLVEASKASTGNIKVELMQVSLNEMISQLLGEHADGLDKKKLNVIADIPENDVTVRADGKLLYRVMENLIVNVEKYSLYGTRVYVTVKQEDNYGTVTFKNISEQPLNITADQLKERFVRGDESRSTEGNGLGLSIAQSLCNVQGGELEISISGDLFTAKVKLAK